MGYWLHEVEEGVEGMLVARHLLHHCELWIVSLDYYFFGALLCVEILRKRQKSSRHDSRETDEEEEEEREDGGDSGERGERRRSVSGKKVSPIIVGLMVG